MAKNRRNQQNQPSVHGPLQHQPQSRFAEGIEEAKVYPVKKEIPAPQVDYNYIASDLENASNAIALYELNYGLASVHNSIAVLIQEQALNIQNRERNANTSVILEPPLRQFIGNDLRINNLINGELVSDKARHKEGHPKTFTDQALDAVNMLEACRKVGRLQVLADEYLTKIGNVLHSGNSEQEDNPTEAIAQ